MLGLMIVAITVAASSVPVIVLHALHSHIHNNHSPVALTRIDRYDKSVQFSDVYTALAEISSYTAVTAVINHKCRTIHNRYQA